jgi:hypothetical protein
MLALGVVDVCLVELENPMRSRGGEGQKGRQRWRMRRGRSGRKGSQPVWLRGTYRLVVVVVVVVVVVAAAAAAVLFLGCIKKAVERGGWGSQRQG